MKIRIEIDCTPEEARSFLGLPDFKPMQAALMAKFEEQMKDAVSKLTPVAVQAWSPWVQWAGLARDTAEKAAQAMGESAKRAARDAS
jgi:Family of unknown function (DUF6489)